MFALSADELLYGLIAALPLMACWMFVTLRFGLLASAATFFVFFVLMNQPPSFDGGAWYLSSTLPGTIIVLALAFFGLRNALGGQERA